MRKVVYTSKGLTCANCALKIEDQIKKLEDVEEVRVDPIHEKITIVGDELDQELLRMEIQKISDRYEKGVSIALNQQELKKENHFDLGRLIVSGLLFIAGFIFTDIQFYLYLISFVIVGYDILWRALQNIMHREFFDENFLMSLATIAAIAIGEVPEAAAVMLFYQVGEYLQARALAYSRKSIRDLVELKVDEVMVLEQGTLVSKKAEAIREGELLVVRKGEKVAVDGTLMSSKANLDCSAITGESLPVVKHQNDEVMAGSMNTGESIQVKAMNDYAHSSIAKTIAMIEEATTRKAKTEKFITKFAKIYTPIVVILAILLWLGVWLFSQNFQAGIYRAAIFLVISCPCALVISIPLSYFAAIGKASRLGVMIKGGQFLEALRHLDVVAFDKTGTLTKGNFTIQSIHAQGMEEAEMLRKIASIERYSTHPIAQAILNNIDGNEVVTRVQEVEGEGIIGVIDDVVYGVGNAKMMERFNQKVNEEGIHFASHHAYYGYLVLADELKPHARETIEALHAQGVEVWLLSGDHQKIVSEIGKTLQMDEAMGDLLPEDKLHQLQTLKDQGKRFIYIGDGINDGPALALADVGMAMGVVGSDVAIESADVVLMNDNLDNVAKSIQLAKKTRKIVLQNIVFVLLVKAIVLILGALGFASMWLAIFADVGVSLLAILNALRLLEKKL